MTPGVRTHLLLVLLLVLLYSCADGQFVATEDLAQLIQWPWPRDVGTPESDRVFTVNVNVPKTEACFEACMVELDSDPEDQGAAWSEDEVILRAQATAPGVEHTDTSSATRQERETNQVERLWDCEKSCGILHEIPQAKLWDWLQKAKVLLLWDSTSFADLAHSQQALRELVAIAQRAEVQDIRLVLYSYTGWEPAEQQIKRWWRSQHQHNLRPWQASPASFGGWGRATLSLVERGEIMWDAQDIVHGAKHWDLLHDVDHSLDLELQGFLEETDLHGALEHVQNVHYPDHAVPFQVCLHIARTIYGGKENIPDLVSQAGHALVDALAEFCQHLDMETQEDLVAHRGDMDYEMFHKHASDLGLVRKNETVWEHTRKTWRKVVTFVTSVDRDQASRFNAQREAKAFRAPLSLVLSAVPAFEDGLKHGLGDGERHMALLFSVCYRNSTIPPGTVEGRYLSRAGRHRQEGELVVNADRFLTLVPCGSLAPQQVRECIKAVLADVRASTWDLEERFSGPPVELQEIVFGSGFADEARYRGLSKWWSIERTTQEYPPLRVTERFANAMNPAKMGSRTRPKQRAEKDEL